MPLPTVFILVLLTRMGIQFQTTVRAFLHVVKSERFRLMRWGIDKVKKSVEQGVL
jgi:hypothetical protein